MTNCCAVTVPGFLEECRGCGRDGYPWPAETSAIFLCKQHRKSIENDITAVVEAGRTGFEDGAAEGTWPHPLTILVREADGWRIQHQNSLRDAEEQAVKARLLSEQLTADIFGGRRVS